MDPEPVIKNGRVVDTADLKRRVKLYTDYQRDGYGAIIVQANVEDTRLGVQEYAIEKLGVEMRRAEVGPGRQGHRRRGQDQRPQESPDALRARLHRPARTRPTRTSSRPSSAGAFKEFERHSRVGMVTEESFAQRVEELRKAGAKYIFLKTGAYRPADLARAVKFASKYKLDLLTVDGAGGGTGMSPWRMMNEWGVPPVELHSLLYQYAKRLADKGEYVAGARRGRRLHLRGPDLQGPGPGRAVRQAGRHGPRADRRGHGRQDHRPDASRRTRSRSTSSVSAARRTRSSSRPALCARSWATSEFEKLPTGALGLYTYYERLAQGLRQLMAGSRKFALEYIIARRHRRADAGSGRDQRHPVHHGRGQGRNRPNPDQVLVVGREEKSTAETQRTVEKPEFFTYCSLSFSAFLCGEFCGFYGNRQSECLCCSG